MTPMTRHGIRVRLVRNLEDYLARTAADLDDRGEVLEERRAALARLEAQLIAQEDVLAERRRRIEELSLPEETNRLVDELFKRLDDWEATAQKLRTEVGSLQQQVATARETSRQLQRDRAEQDARLAESERELESAREAHTRAVHELEARSRELERLLDQERSRREEAGAAAHVEHPGVETHRPGTRAAIAEEGPSSHLLFRQGADGYELVAREGPPPPVGSEIRWPDADESFIVLNVGTSPLPSDPRPCAFLQLVTRA
jgi:DNA repair exonuclease SbcCD ATPase subunit